MARCVWCSRHVTHTQNQLFLAVFKQQLLLHYRYLRGCYILCYYGEYLMREYTRAQKTTRARRLNSCCSLLDCAMRRYIYDVQPFLLMCIAREASPSLLLLLIDLIQMKSLVACGLVCHIRVSVSYFFLFFFFASR